MAAQCLIIFYETNPSGLKVFVAPAHLVTQEVANTFDACPSLVEQFHLPDYTGKEEYARARLPNHLQPLWGHLHRLEYEGNNIFKGHFTTVISLFAERPETLDSFFDDIHSGLETLTLLIQESSDGRNDQNDHKNWKNNG